MMKISTLSRYPVNTGWWEIDIHDCYSLMKINSERVQEQSTNMTSQYQYLAFAWRHRSTQVWPIIFLRWFYSEIAVLTKYFVLSFSTHLCSFQLNGCKCLPVQLLSSYSLVAKEKFCASVLSGHPSKFPEIFFSFLHFSRLALFLS